MRKDRKIGMTKQCAYYLGQGPWFIIKEYLGLYSNKYAYSEFMKLEAEVVEEVWKTHNPLWPAFGEKTRPQPYGWHRYTWDKDSTAGWKRGHRHYTNEVRDAYMLTRHPGVLASKYFGTGALGRLADDPNLEPVALPFLKINQLQNSERKRLEKLVTYEVTKGAVEAYNEFAMLSKQGILAACVAHPRRKLIYHALDQAVRLGKRKCLCGCVVATKTKAFERHLKTNKHTKKIVLDANAVSVAAWHHHSGVLPPGWQQALGKSAGPEADYAAGLTHRIPPDSKRYTSHPAIYTRGFNLNQHISWNGWGRGTRVVRPINNID